VIVDQLRQLGSECAPDEAGPVDGPKPGSSTVNDSQLTAVESMALIASINASPNRQLKFILSLLILTGARQRELLQARWSDIDLERRAWKLTKLRSGDKRETPLNEAAILVLRQLTGAEDCDFMFANPTTKKPYNSLAKSWDTARTKAGLSDLEIDDLRYCIGDRVLFVAQMLDLIEDEGSEAECETPAGPAAGPGEDISTSTGDASELELLEAVDNGREIRFITDQRPSHEREGKQTPPADLPEDASAILLDGPGLELSDSVVSDEQTMSIVADRLAGAEGEGLEIPAAGLAEHPRATPGDEARFELPELPVSAEQEMRVAGDHLSDAECDDWGTYAVEHPQDASEALADAPELELREAAVTNGEAVSIIENHGFDIECGECELPAAACPDDASEAAKNASGTPPPDLAETNRPEVRVARRQTLLEKWWTHQGSNLGPAD